MAQAPLERRAYRVKGEKGSKGAEGKEGALGTAGTTLPPEATETGSWAFRQHPSAQEPGEALKAALSFPIPLEAALSKEHVHYINKAGLELPAEVSPTECGTPAGTSAEPKASPGNLCVYEARNVGMRFYNILQSGNQTEEGGASTTGAVLFMKGEEEARADGTWAVTAP